MRRTALVIGLLAAGAPAHAAGSERLSNERTITRVAHVYAAAPVRLIPLAGAPVIDRLHFHTEQGVLETYLALRRDRDWIKIRLPGRPNGRTGWVRRAALGPFLVRYKQLVIDREALRATLFRSGEAIWTSPVGVGKASTPTPAGHFWIRERLRSLGPTYGPWAFGTSAYSVLSEWPGGGVIGLHGTDEPQLIPGRPSHGCIRLPNRAIRRLKRQLPVGTPLLIR
jgi:hypothetical protein